MQHVRRWNLEMFEFAPAGQWVRLKLHVYCERQQDNRSFALGWNGLRLAKDHGIAGVCDQFPQVAEELAEWLEWAQP